MEKPKKPAGEARRLEEAPGLVGSIESEVAEAVKLLRAAEQSWGVPV
jgi:hypothetical protein